MQHAIYEDIYLGVRQSATGGEGSVVFIARTLRTALTLAVEQIQNERGRDGTIELRLGDTPSDLHLDLVSQHDDSGPTPVTIRIEAHSVDTLLYDL